MRIMSPWTKSAAANSGARLLRRDGSEFRVETGRFRAYMEVSLVNDGPVTFVVDF